MTTNTVYSVLVIPNTKLFLDDILHAVETNKEMGFHDIILEEDALQIVNAIKATCNNWSSFDHIIDDIKLELRQLQSWRIDHVKRDANTTTHTITKKTILCVIDRFWIKEISNCICRIISRELLPLGD
jgi:hypothetical protein